MKENKTIMALYIGGIGGFLLALSNFIFGGGPSRFGWVKASNPTDQIILCVVFSLVCFLLAFCLSKKKHQ